MEFRFCWFLHSAFAFWVEVVKKNLFLRFLYMFLRFWRDFFFVYFTFPTRFFFLRFLFTFPTRRFFFSFLIGNSIPDAVYRFGFFHAFNFLWIFFDCRNGFTIRHFPPFVPLPLLLFVHDTQYLNDLFVRKCEMHKKNIL